MSMHAVSELNLNLPARWFTGEEWADGTAETVIAQDYRDALIEAGYEAPKEVQGNLL